MCYALFPVFSPIEIYSMVGRSERNAGLVLRLWGGGSEQGSWSENFSCNFEDGGDVDFT